RVREARTDYPKECRTDLSGPDGITGATIWTTKPILSGMRSRAALVLVLAVLVFAIVPTRAADTLPAQLSDAAFWKLITDFSEPDGFFQYVVITSNETAYQEVIPQLTKAVPPGGTYLGVGPEQNFTYIAALQPKIAFIIDIRRDMMIEHLLYKAVFE